MAGNTFEDNIGSGTGLVPNQIYVAICVTRPQWVQHISKYDLFFWFINEAVFIIWKLHEKWMSIFKVVKS